MSARPTAPVIVTAGEPAGVGPELCLELARQRPAADFAVIASAKQLTELSTEIDDKLSIQPVDPDSPDWPAPSPGTLRVVPLDYPAAIVPGAPDPLNAPTMLEGLGLAADGCRAGRFRALVTGPLQKRSVIDAGIPFSGHTEFLAERTGAALPVMLLTAGELRVALVTTHLPLRKVPDAITTDRVESIIRVLDQDLRAKFGIERPSILVCGLNPHAGEGGHLGTEDEAIIRPVVERLAASGLEVRGPVPADTAFTPAAGPADAVLAMYHDQGLPVLKHAGFGHSINVTLGLPIVRTSVDHGTALDIAGTGTADAGSLLAAFDLAFELTRP